MAIGRWQAWRPFTIDSIGHFAPEEIGVYELIDSRGATQYIGKAGKSIRSRLLSHTKDPDFAIVAHFHFKLVSHKFEAKDLESDLIKEYKDKHDGHKPPLNKVTPRKKSTPEERYYQT